MCYSIACWRDVSTFVMGLDVAHPDRVATREGNPSTVGVGFNFGIIVVVKNVKSKFRRLPWSSIKAQCDFCFDIVFSMRDRPPIRTPKR